VGSLDHLPLPLGSLQTIIHMNSANDQNALVTDDLSLSIAHQAAIGGVNLTRFQRAPEGASQSTGRGGHHIVDGGGVARETVGWNSIVSRYLAMHSKTDRVLFCRQVGPPHGSAFAFDLHSRNIYRIHVGPP